MQKFSVICYTMRILTLIFWGGYIMTEADYKIGQTIGTNEHLVSLYFTIFITVREMVLFPVLIVRQLFRNRLSAFADDLAPGEDMGKEGDEAPKQTLLESMDPGIFNLKGDRAKECDLNPSEVQINSTGDDDDYRAAANGGIYCLSPGDDGKRELEIDDSIYCLTFVCMLDTVRLHWGFTKDLEDYFFKSAMIFSI